MKREKTNIKKIIKAKINFNQKPAPEKPKLTIKGNVVPDRKIPPITTRERLMQEYKDTPVKKHSKQETAYHVGNPNASTNQPKVKKPHVDIPVVLKDYGVYVKKENVDVDAVICVCSYERFDKVKRLLDQIYTQNTKYTFQFNLMNDASTDKRYDLLPELFPKLKYIKNEGNGGKENYWKTVNKLWRTGSEQSSHVFIQIDDDFILCDNFLDRLLDEFFMKKEEDNRFMVFSYHVYGYDRYKPQADWWYNGTSIAIDGGTMFDARFMQMFNYYVNVGDRYIAAHTSTFVWDTIVQYIRDFGVRVHRCPNSLAWHDGNYDSKLNYIARQSKKSYTKNFIDGDDKYDPTIDFNEVK